MKTVHAGPKRSLVIALLVVGGAWLVISGTKGTQPDRVHEVVTSSYVDPLPEGASVRLGTSCLRHRDSSWCVAVSPDGKTIASGGQDRVVRLWDAETGRAVNVIGGYRSEITGVCFSFDGRLIAAGGPEDPAGIWEASTGRKLMTLEGKGGCRTLAFSPVASVLAGGYVDGIVHVWDVGTGMKRLTLNYEDDVYSVAFSPDGCLLAAGGGQVGERVSIDGEDRSVRYGSQSSVRVWNVDDGRDIVKLAEHRQGILAVRFAPDGKSLISGGWDRIICLSDVLTGKELRRWKASGFVYSLAFSPDGGTVAAATRNFQIEFWNVPTGKALKGIEAETSNVIPHVHASSARDGLAQFEPLLSFMLVPTVSALAYLPDGRMLVSTGHSGRVRLWDVKSGREVNPVARQAPLNACRLSPDGRRVVTAGADGTVRLWDVGTGREVRRMAAHVGEVLAVEFSPDGKVLVSGGDDLTLRFWGTETGEPLRVVEKHGGEIRALAFSPDGKSLVSGSYDRTLRLADTATGQALAVLRGHEGPVNSLAFSPDGKFIASGSEDRSVRVWDVTGRKEAFSFREAASSILAVAFSPDGKVIAAGDRDGVVWLWQYRAGKNVKLSGHAGEVLAIAFSRDGLFSAGADRLIRAWNLATVGKVSRTFQGHYAAVRSLDVSADGKVLTSASEDSTVLVWDLSAPKH